MTDYREFQVFHTKASTPNREKIVFGTMIPEWSEIFAAITPEFVLKWYANLGVVVADEDGSGSVNGMLEEVFTATNALGWFDNPVTQGRIREMNSHTSTSVGDVVRDNSTGKMFVVDNVGWKCIGAHANWVRMLEADRVDAMLTDDLREEENV